MAGGRIPATGEVVATQSQLGASQRNRVLYVGKVGADGWLQMRDDASKSLQPVCKYTKLTPVESTAAGRSSFKVMDGPQKGKTLSLSDANVGEYLGTKAPVQSAVRAVVTYGAYVEGWISVTRNNQKIDQQMATLAIDGLSVQVTMNSVWGTGFTPLPAGEYTILLPDAPHDKDMTRGYRRSEPGLRFDQVWFPIRHGDNSRYVHVGNLSDGCTTVLDLAHWADVHEALISHRAPDGASVGTLVVVGTPQRPV